MLKANAADGGKRRFILVSSTEATEEEPQKNLCREVCAERVRRVIAGYGEKAGLGGDFAYLRCRRIPEGELMEIEHSQVWTALQLIHREGLTAYAPAALHWVQDGEGALCYVPQVKASTAREILKRGEGHARGDRLYLADVPAGTPSGGGGTRAGGNHPAESGPEIRPREGAAVRGWKSSSPTRRANACGGTGCCGAARTRWGQPPC